jgi:hypothetical protein
MTSKKVKLTAHYSSVCRFLQLLTLKLREEDKVKHMVWSFFLTLAALTIWPAYLAFSAVFVIGLVKECWDFRFGSGFCLYDMTGNVIGSLVGLTFGLLLIAIFSTP